MAMQYEQALGRSKSPSDFRSMPGQNCADRQTWPTSSERGTRVTTNSSVYQPMEMRTVIFSQWLGSDMQITRFIGITANPT